MKDEDDFADFLQSPHNQPGSGHPGSGSDQNFNNEGLGDGGVPFFGIAEPQIEVSRDYEPIVGQGSSFFDNEMLATSLTSGQDSLMASAQDSSFLSTEGSGPSPLRSHSNSDLGSMLHGQSGDASPYHTAFNSPYLDTADAFPPTEAHPTDVANLEHMTLNFSLLDDPAQAVQHGAVPQVAHHSNPQLGGQIHGHLSNPDSGLSGVSPHGSAAPPRSPLPVIDTSFDASMANFGFNPTNNRAPAPASIDTAPKISVDYAAPSPSFDLSPVASIKDEASPSTAESSAGSSPSGGLFQFPQVQAHPQGHNQNQNLLSAPSPTSRRRSQSDPPQPHLTLGSSAGSPSGNGSNGMGGAGGAYGQVNGLLSPETAEIIAERRARSASTSSSRRSSSRSRSASRDYILELATPSTSNKRVQKHPSAFACTLCDKRFTRAYNLRSHLRTHTDERPFVCTVCGKAFARQHDRKRHEALHSGEKKFECRGTLADGTTIWGCGRKFARADALGRHFRTEAGRECIRPLLEEEARERNRLRMSAANGNGANGQSGDPENVSIYVGGDKGAPSLTLSPPSNDVTDGGFAFPAALLQQFPSLINANLTGNVSGEELSDFEQ